jgi:hypothetical protein
LHFDGATGAVIGGVKGFYRILKGIPMSNKGVGNVGIT